MNNDVRAIVYRTPQNRGRYGIVDDKWHAVPVGNIRQGFDIADIAGRIADRFTKNSTGLSVDQPFDRIGGIALRKSGANALPRQGMRQ